MHYSYTMLAKRNKLNSVEFRRVFTQGRTVHSNSFTIKYLAYRKPLGRATWKAAVVVSKKHSKTIIRRNHTRRVVYNILSDLYKKGVPTDKTLVIIILKKDALLKTTPQELRTELADKLGVL